VSLASTVILAGETAAVILFSLSSEVFCFLVGEAPSVVCFFNSSSAALMASSEICSSWSRSSSSREALSACCRRSTSSCLLPVTGKPFAFNSFFKSVLLSPTRSLL